MIIRQALAAAAEAVTAIVTSTLRQDYLKARAAISCLVIQILRMVQTNAGTN